MRGAAAQNVDKREHERQRDWSEHQPGCTENQQPAHNGDEDCQRVESYLAAY
jgi:hypothetical protein